MSFRQYRVRNPKYCFQPDSKGPYRISRSKIDLFLNCPQCFYLDQRLGISHPSTPPFSLNAAVDELLKKEFDLHRTAQSRHPLLESYGVDAVPLQHERIEEWRDALTRGVQYHDKETNLIIRGGIDDVWQNSAGELLVVDYKATSKKEEVSLDADWQIAYKRQVEVYQWLFRQNGFTVSDTAYFVYVNGKTDTKAFDGKLEFSVKLIPYVGDASWIPKTIHNIKACLMDDEVPQAAADCEYCAYRKEAGEKLLEIHKRRKQVPLTKKSYAKRNETSSENLFT